MTLNRPEHHEFTIGAQRQEVMFRDGTAVTLLPVFDNQAPCLFLRALTVQAETRVIDLRQLVRQLGDDLLSAAARDVPGIVFYTLRHHYCSAEPLLRQVVLSGKALTREGALQ